MKIIIHGKLAKLVGSQHEIATNRVADAIEGLSRQCPAWPRDMLIDVVGFDTQAKLNAPTDIQEIHLVPALVGGGGFVKIVIGAALIAVAIIGAPVFGAWVSMALFSIGLSLVMNGVMQLFMKAPSVDKSEDPPPSRYLGGGGNTTGVGTYRTNAWGRVRIPGHWLSLQVDAKAIVKGRFPTTAP